MVFAVLKFIVQDVCAQFTGMVTGKCLGPAIRSADRVGINLRTITFKTVSPCSRPQATTVFIICEEIVSPYNVTCVS